MESLFTGFPANDEQFPPLDHGTASINSIAGMRNNLQTSPRRSMAAIQAQNRLPLPHSLSGSTFSGVITNFQYLRYRLPSQRKDIECVLVTLTPNKQVFHKNIVVHATTDLITLITQLQGEIDLVLGTATHLLSTIKIFHGALTNLPQIAGELLGPSDDLEVAHSVKWECRKGIYGHELVEYWDCLREWLAVQKNRDDQRAIIRIDTVLQQATENTEMSGIARGHHFVRSLDELHGVSDSSQPISSTPQEIVLRKTLNLVTIPGKAPAGVRVDEMKRPVPTKRQTPTADIDPDLIATIRAAVDEKQLTFRPSTPELILTNKILYKDGSMVDEGKPSYEEMMEMHEDMMEAGYRCMPAWVYKEKENRVSRGIYSQDWGTFQKVGRDADVRLASNVIDLGRVTCDLSRAPVFVEADDPLYNEPYRLGSDTEWENIVTTLYGGNVELVPEVRDVDYVALANEVEMRRQGQHTQTPPFAAGRAFDSDDDDIFCVGRDLAERESYGPTANVDAVVQTLQEQEAEKRRQIAYEIAQFNADKFGRPSTTSRGYQATLLQYHPSASSNTMTPYQQKLLSKPPVPGRSTSSRSLTPHNVLPESTNHRSRSGSGNTADSVTYRGASMTPGMSNHGNLSGRSTPTTDMSFGRTSNFNPSTPAFQFQAGPTNLNQNVRPPQFNPYRVNSSNGVTTNWHNFAFNHAQPQNNFADRASSGMQRNTIKSPFSHRFSVRLDPLQAPDYGALSSPEANPLLSQNPLHRGVTTLCAGEPRSPSPSTTHVQHSNQTYRTSLRPEKPPVIEPDEKMLGRMQESSAVRGFGASVRGQHGHIRKRSDMSFASN